MQTVSIYHNPNCSKSREALALLEQQGVKPDIIFYLETPPSFDTLQTLVHQLGLSSARDMMRQGEEIYQELKLAEESSEEALIQAMADHPRLIERPIVVANGKARIGRPPERVLEIL